MSAFGRIIAVAGSDPKAGSSMIAKSLAEELAKETGEAVLYLTDGDGSCVVAPWNDAEMGLAEAGISRYATGPRTEHYRELRGRFAFAVLDSGPDAAEGADRVVCVVNQFASSIREAERRIPRLEGRLRPDGNGDTAEGPGRRLICLNRFLPGDPHDCAYIRRLFPGWNVIPFPEAACGREADWEGVTITKLGDRPFRKAVREGVKWILNS